MDLRKLKTLIDLVSESNVSELEITEAEGKVRIVKGGGGRGPAICRPCDGRSTCSCCCQYPRPCACRSTGGA